MAGLLAQRRPGPPWVAVPRLSTLAACLWAAPILAAGAAARVGLAPWLADRDVYLLFVPAVVAAAAFAGLGAGLALSVAGIFAGALLGPPAPPGPGGAIQAGIFLFVGALVSLGGEWFQRARLQTEDALADVARQAGRLRMVLETVPDAMITVDGGGVIRSFSPSAERLFGWSAAEVVGREVSTLMPAPDPDASPQDLAPGPDDGGLRGPGVRIAVGERRDGSTFPMELAIGDLATEEGPALIAFARDLTERERSAARLRELQSELVHVSRLTALGEMASALAHELNQPLSAISNYLKGARIVLSRDPADPRVAHALEKGAEEALRAGQIIRRLRDFVSSGESEPRLEPLAALVEEASALALVGAKEHGVRARFHLDAGLEPVLADKVQIQQVVVNLVRNAVDSLVEAGGPVREIRIGVRALDASFAEVSVADTGPGLSPEVSGQLFQPFITTKRNGMGVGLSISRTIVEAHGGRIWAEPNPGGGAVFRFTLRRARPEEAAA